MPIETLMRSKLSFPGKKPKMPILMKRAHFSETSIALYGVNVIGGYVIKPFTREIGTGQKFVSL